MDETQILQQIADLLQQRVAIAERTLQHQETQDRKREEKSSKAIEELKNQKSAFERPEIPGKDDSKHDEQMKRIQERGDRIEQERRVFQERLLAEFSRHNDLLERILTRLEQQ